jgi:uncharacterized protein (TIGR02453 family)
MLDFLRDLSANNNRNWFEENKKRYEATAKQPFEDIIQLVLDEIAADDAAFEHTIAKNCIYRIYRDVRFSANKTPYKDHLSAVIAADGRKQENIQGLYIELSGGRLFMAGGAYQPTPVQVAAVRAAMVAEAPRFEAMLNDAEFKFCFGTMIGEEHKRLSPSFAEAAKTQPLLLKKQFLYVAELPASTILADDIAAIVLRYYRATLAMSTFLDEQMG